MPFVGGQLFLMFKDHYTTYHFLFWWQLALSVVCAIIFATIPEPLREDELLAAGAADGGSQRRRYRAPVGARLCDLVCFGSRVRMLEAPLKLGEGNNDGDDTNDEEIAAPAPAPSAAATPTTPTQAALAAAVT
jgi:hypothetical protein